MGEKTADEQARELLFTTRGEREAHAAAMQALLAGNTALRTNDELITEQLRVDSEFRAEWERTALGRAAAVAMVHYRAEHDLSQQELAGLLEMTAAQIAEFEVGDANPSADTVDRISARLGSALGPLQ
ncbi:MAG TPA: helix-turn-helix transcriptional regulator [Solirubrobacteraceae bacterium]|nr:helix-turn-helix transcriptional regulator [Solirubrobacteraceae bacterium]